MAVAIIIGVPFLIGWVLYDLIKKITSKLDFNWIEELFSFRTLVVLFVVYCILYLIDPTLVQAADQQ